MMLCNKKSKFYSLKRITMKIFNQLSWVAFGAAVFLFICAVIDHLNGGGYFGLKHSSTFVSMANTALIGGVFLKLWSSKG